MIEPRELDGGRRPHSALPTRSRLSSQAMVRLGILALVATLSACNATLPKLPVQIANFAAGHGDVEGTWTGSYLCSQGLTGVRLTLTPAGPGMLSGRYEFFPLPGQSNPSGSFAVTAVMQPGRVELSPGAWIVRPANYTTLRVSATVFSDPDKLVGVVNEAGCGKFEVARVTKTAAPVLAAPNPQVAPMPQPVPAAAPAPARTTTTAQTSATQPVATGPRAISHAEFVKRIGSQKLPSLVGTALQLNLKRGGDGGWDGFIEDPQSLVFFRCPISSRFGGGALVAKVARLRSNDSGVIVDLDRCGP